MFQREFSISLPRGRQRHSSRVALATILVVNPFVGNRLVPPLKVSSRFQIAANSVLSRYKISDHVDPLLSPREQPSTSIPMLAFSGGVDSTAALSVMPKNTISIFMDRPKRKIPHNPQAAHLAVESLEDIGYVSKSVQCDLEYVRHSSRVSHGPFQRGPCDIASRSFHRILDCLRNSTRICIRHAKKDTEIIP